MADIPLPARLAVDLCVIGAGAAGLSVTAGAAQLGLEVALIERAAMGGECLNTGCVPSKALLAAAHMMALPDRAKAMGITMRTEADFSAVRTHIQGVIDKIAPHDSQERFEGLGVHVIRQSARFTDAHTVMAGDTTITARHFVIATGSAPAIPPIPGLDHTRVLTNETLFARPERPDHLIIIGGGPVGLEMAQAYRRLGARVTVVERDHILPHDDTDATAILRQTLAAADIRIIEKANIINAIHEDSRTILEIEGHGQVWGDAVLVAAGRTPRTDGLDLAAAGVEHDKGGIIVDRHLRTAQRHIYALGDCAGGPGGGPRLTHVAGYQAGIIIRNMLFKIPAKADYSAVPHVTYTDPALAHVGLTQKTAQDQYGDKHIRATIWHQRENDRALAEHDTAGLIKIVTGRGGRILGATLIGPAAAEQINLWSLAIAKKMKMKDIAGLVVPYPTFGEISKRVAGAYYSESLFSPRTQKLVGFLERLPF